MLGVYLLNKLNTEIHKASCYLESLSNAMCLLTHNVLLKFMYCLIIPHVCHIITFQDITQNTL